MENNNLPGWQVLASWEKVTNRDKLVSSISTFYIKSDFITTDKRFIAHYPNIILWCLPLWFNNLTFNLKQISWVNINISYKIFKILIWIILFIISLSSLWSWNIWVMLLTLIWSVIFLSLWIQVYIAVSSSGWTTYCPVVFWEKSKANELIQKLNSTIAENV